MNQIVIDAGLDKEADIRTVSPLWLEEDIQEVSYFITRIDESESSLPEKFLAELDKFFKIASAYKPQPTTEQINRT